jgi:phosphohistidine phosphatase
MKTLILCRHAKSDWPEHVADLDRPLKQRGVRDAQQLGKLLAEQEVQPEAFFCSPARRARQTAEIIAETLKFPEKIVIEPSIYHEGAERLLEQIRNLPHHLESAIFFGHNPTLEHVVQRLLRCAAPFYMPTCAMVCFETLAPTWAQLDTSNLHLRWMLIPRLRRSGGE